jgi:probable HAF family extracellular repeat protein
VSSNCDGCNGHGVANGAWWSPLDRWAVSPMGRRQLNSSLSALPVRVILSCLSAALLLCIAPHAVSAIHISICTASDGSALVSDAPCPPDAKRAEVSGQLTDVERHRNRMFLLCAAPQLMNWLKAQQHVDNEIRNAKLQEFLKSCRQDFEPPAAASLPDGLGRPYTPEVPPFTEAVDFAKDPTVLRTPPPVAHSVPPSATAAERGTGVVQYGAGRALVNMDHSTTFDEPQVPVIFDLGRLSAGRNSSYASGISADGKLVVGSANHGNYSQVAFTWTPNSGMVSLDQSVAIRRFAEASAVDRDGSVIVGSWDADRTGLSRAFRWTRKTGIVTLGILPGADRSNATAVSADGQVVVGHSERAFRWSERTGMVALMGGRTTFGATAVSADGRSVFGDESGPDGSHVIRWDENGTITRYAKPLGALDASVHAVTPDGSVAVGQYSFPIGTEFRVQAAVWYSQTHLVSLGFLHGGNFSKATAVSADGSVIVGNASDGAANNRHTAFRWTAATGMQSVEEWIRAAGGSPSGLDTDEALGVSGDGLAVVGALKNGNPFFAIVPHH